MVTADLLSSDDGCRRRAFYGKSWRPPSLRPLSVLRMAIEHGLEAVDDPPEAAHAFAMETCCQYVLDTVEINLLDLAEHIACFAQLAVHLLRTSDPWERPQPKAIGEGVLWHSSAYTGRSGALRSLAVVDRLDGLSEMSLRNAWRVRGECAAYQSRMDILVLVIGSMRNCRWANPFTTAWRHPVAKTLRFRRRDGDNFGATWVKVERERDEATLDQWLDAMTDDGVLSECIRYLPVEIPVNHVETVELATSKLGRIAAQTEAPEPQISSCFHRLHPCPFRNCCPEGVEPSEANGFIRI